MAPEPRLQAGVWVAAYLARFQGQSRVHTESDLRCFITWCEERGLDPLSAQRAHVELYVRWMEDRGYAPATIGRRFTTVAGFDRYAVLDGHLQADRSVAVTRPKVPWEGQRRTVLHPWSSPRCPPPPATTVRAATPWSRCSE